MSPFQGLEELGIHCYNHFMPSALKKNAEGMK